MLELDASGQRFSELLNLIDDPAGERGISQERLPLVRHVRGEIRDDRLAGAGVMKPRPEKREPFDSRDLVERLDSAERHDRVPPPDGALRIDVKCVEPDDVEKESQGEADTVVGKA